ncbi:MAG: hypothetical protein WCV85_01970 [Patescibacteria group bacterium]|jgi:hypothetical protein
MHDPKEFTAEESLSHVEAIEEAEEELPPDEKDLELEKEMELTGKEQEWEEHLLHDLKDWKAARSSQPVEAQDAILHMKAKFDRDDIVLYHAWQQVKKSPSPYFRQKFGKLLRHRLEKFDDKRDSNEYRLAKTLRAMQPEE